MTFTALLEYLDHFIGGIWQILKIAWGSSTIPVSMNQWRLDSKYKATVESGALWAEFYQMFDLVFPLFCSAHP